LASSASSAFAFTVAGTIRPAPVSKSYRVSEHSAAGDAVFLRSHRAPGWTFPPCRD